VIAANVLLTNTNATAALANEMLLVMPLHNDKPWRGADVFRTDEAITRNS
jgi:hypothetical protein